MFGYNIQALNILSNKDSYVQKYKCIRFKDELVPSASAVEDELVPSASAVEDELVPSISVVEMS